MIALDQREWALPGEMCRPEVQQRVLELADSMLEARIVDGVEGDAVQPELELARRLVASRQAVLANARAFKIGVVFAMWREGARIRPPALDNPRGENCIEVKAQALDWLFRDTPITWEIFAVDDGCDQGSGDAARAMAANSAWQKRIHVLDLCDNPFSTRKPLSHLRSPSDSIKGGAIMLGCLAAAEAGCDYVVYTDCDNSVSVGQIGLLLHPVLTRQLKVVMGDRALPGTLQWRSPQRYSNDKYVVLKHMRAMLSEAIGLTDFTSPFKCFATDVLLRIIEDIRVFNFAFDYDVVLSALAKGYKPASVEYSFYDSFEESTWHHHGVARVWFDQFQGLVAALRRHRIPHNAELANFIAEHIRHPDDVAALVDTPPPAPLRFAPSALLGKQTTYSAAELVAWGGHRRDRVEARQELAG